MMALVVFNPPTLSTHPHLGVGPSQQAPAFTTLKESVVKLSSDLTPITA
ncbi:MULTISPECIES: hypothetical protein [Colwellia]|uniref:Uncharacterized protein n=1 Tax=Colwellia marinimaniae TaxID=1513592 RepID=A0ABQ0MS91_9GAMM|nr:MULTISPECIES: hypothetical protein [Colwellia]GAW95239.1 hypothetical protein MTCD1_00841 [Colwellia marinimaniae]